MLAVSEAGGRGHPQPQHQPAARVSRQDQLVELPNRCNSTIVLGLFLFISTNILIVLGSSLALKEVIKALDAACVDRLQSTHFSLKVTTEGEQ